MKNMLSKFKGLDRKLLSYIIIGSIVVFGIIIVLIILKVAIFSKITPEQLEDKMVIAAENYFYNKKEALPLNDKDVATVTISELVNSGNLKSLDKLLKDKNLSCSGEVTVTKNENYYLYSPNLNCGNAYKTKKLYEVITATENIVSESDGLYKIENDYVYRGEKVNNYVEFAGQLWRILRVNGSDNSVKLIQENKTNDKYVWDDRYNKEKDTYIGINNYSVSRIKDTINEYWNGEDILTNNYKPYISTQLLCTGTRNLNSTDKTNKTECSKNDGNSSFILLQPSDFIITSLDTNCKHVDDANCTNYNYLANMDGSTWTTISSSETSYQVYKIDSSPYISKTNATSSLKFVINLSSEVNFNSGDGTFDNPYTIKIY